MSPAFTPASKLVVCLAAVFSLSAAAEVPRGEVMIRTRDGHLVAGKIISETSRGYLLSTAAGTTVVAFTSIADLQPVNAPAVPSLTPPPRPPPTVAPVQSTYERPARPLEEFAPAPATPPAEPIATVTDRQIIDWLEPRQGLHFGAGAIVSPVPFTLSLMVKGHVTYGFGRFCIDISPRIGFTGNASYGGGLGFGVDSQFRFAIVPWLSIGAGYDLGGEVGAYYSGFRSGPSVTFADVTLGERAQHRLSLWATFPLLSTVDIRTASSYWSAYSRQYEYSWDHRYPFTMATIGYAYMF